MKGLNTILIELNSITNQCPGLTILTNLVNPFPPKGAESLWSNSCVFC